MHAPDPFALRLALTDLGASPDEPVQVKAVGGGFLVRVPRLGVVVRLPAPVHTFGAAVARA